MSRWILFLIMIALGAAAGLYYGWVINPTQYTDTTPASLRADWKADYALMVAETYHSDGDLEQAASRLSVLGKTSPAEIMSNAIAFAVKTNYSEADLTLMRQLSDALKNLPAKTVTPTP